LAIVLQHVSGSRAGQRDTFVKDVITLGRAPGNDVAFDPVKDIRCSARHAEIRRQGDQLVLRDLGSSNGAYINGERVSGSAVIAAGARVELGLGGPAFTAALEFPAAENQPLPPPAAPAAPPLRPREPLPTLIVHHLSGSLKGRVQRFQGTAVSVGRNPNYDLAFDASHDLSVSWRHGRFLWRAGEWFYEDLNSRNGTLVDGVALSSCRITDGATLRFGLQGPEVRVSLAPSPATQAIAPIFTHGAAEDVESIPVVRLDALAIGQSVTIGRAPDQGLRLPHPSVSHLHAAIRHTLRGFTIEDLNSTNGVYVNSQRVLNRCLLRNGDRINIGVYVLTFLGGRLQTVDREGNLRVEAVNLSLSALRRGQPGAPGAGDILRNISLVIRPQEFVGVLGPCGAGKSTLVNVLAGRLRPTGGAVCYDGEDLVKNIDLYRPRIGYVPQQDIVHGELDVESALRYALKLRQPDINRREATARVDSILDQLGLAADRQRQICLLSGGQRKRVNLGVELVAMPELLFLDEVTSGQDMGKDLEMMDLFHRISRQGRTVVCVTHNVEYVDRCDLVALLCGGRLVFYGPPKDMLDYFGIRRVSEVYRRLEDRPCEEWEREYLRTRWRREYVDARSQVRPEAAAPAQPSTASGAVSRVVAPVTARSTLLAARQFATLARRYVAVLSADASNLRLLFLQAPLIALIVSLVLWPPAASAPLAEMAAHRGKVAFMLALVACWFGCSNAVREIVKETAIYLRERLFSLSIPAYVTSKVLPLAALAAAQCAVLLAIVKGFTNIEGDFGPQWLALFAAALASTLMGLLVSAFAATQDRAMSLLPLVLIPQVALSDAVVRLNGLGRFLARSFVVTYWAFDALKATLADVALQGQRGAVLFRHIARPGLSANPEAVLGRIGGYGEDLTALAIFTVVFYALVIIRLKAREHREP